MTDKTETAADGGVDETAADGGVNGGFDEPDSAIKNQFDVIRKSRRRRVVGWALLAGVLGYLLSQGASATEMLETEFRWDAFGDALTQYFPITSRGYPVRRRWRVHRLCSRAQPAVRPGGREPVVPVAPGPVRVFRPETRDIHHLR